MTDRNPMNIALALSDFYRSAQAMNGLSGTAFQAHKDAVLTGLDQQLDLNPDV